MLKTAGSTTDQRSRASFYLARAFEASRELDRAEAKCLDGIAQTEKNYGPRSYIAAFGYENYGDLLRQMSRFDEARRYLQQSLDVNAVVLGPKNLNVSGARYELSQVLSALGERDEDAGPFQTTLGGHQIGIRAGWLMAMGRLVEARGLYTQVLEQWPPSDPVCPLRLLRRALGFSRLLNAEGDAAPARVLLDEVEARLRDKPVDDPYAGPERITLIARRAESARVGGDLPAARTLLAAALVQPPPAPGGDLSSALALLEVLARTAPEAATARAALDTFGSLGDESA